jgi:transcriptional regulator with XRE-family HTH domain
MTNKDTSKLAQNLRDARTRNAMTLAQVAKKTHLSVSFLSDLENNRTDPSLKSLGLLAECYGVPIATLLSGYVPEKAQVVFEEGDEIAVVHFANRSYGLVGRFLRYWDERYYFARGRACDVEIDGVVVAQSVGDLEKVEE